MGTFATSVHVRAEREGALDRALAALRETARLALMDECALEDSADRAVVVLPPDEHGWIAVYDEQTESQDPRVLNALAEALSRACEAPALTVLVHDSDVGEMALFEGGAERDRFCSYPGYPGRKTSKKTRARLAGNAAAWSALLTAGHTPAELRAAWDGRDAFAEATVAGACALIGVTTERAVSGFRSMSHMTPAGAVVLRFRARKRPSYTEAAEGPPRLVFYLGAHQKVQLAQGDTLRLALSTRNAGAAARGLAVVVFGEALERGLVSIQSVELVLGDPRERKFSTHTMEPRKDAAGKDLSAVVLPDVELPAGLKQDPLALPAGPDMLKAMNAGFRTQVHVNIIGRVERPGRGELGIGLSPLANRGAGDQGTFYELECTGPLARPLRAMAPNGHSAESVLLRPLEGTRVLTALLVLDAPRDVAARLAREGLESLLELDPDALDANTAVFHDSGKRPSSGRGKVKTLLRGKRLETLCDAMRTAAAVEVSARVGPQFDPEEGSRPARWSLATGINILGGRDAERVPALLLHADTAALGEHVSTQLEARWSALVRRGMSAGGVQGVVLRSGWTSGMVDMSAYENACGIQGDFISTREWTTRWVRVPGNGLLCLGPALSARLDDAARAKLAAIAEVTPHAGGTEVRLRRREDAPALEDALADLLPSQADAIEFMKAWYARPGARDE